MARAQVSNLWFGSLDLINTISCYFISSILKALQLYLSFSAYIVYEGVMVYVPQASDFYACIRWNICNWDTLGRSLISEVS